jgi:hypothetical protein
MQKSSVELEKPAYDEARLSLLFTLTSELVLSTVLRYQYSTMLTLPFLLRMKTNCRQLFT